MLAIDAHQYIKENDSRVLILWKNTNVSKYSEYMHKLTVVSCEDLSPAT